MSTDTKNALPQLPLVLRYSPDQHLEGFFSAPSGLKQQLRAISQRRNNEWLYLTGVAGTGKTHLCLALCNLAEQQGFRVTYLPLGVAKGRLNEALHALEGNDIIALDNVDAIAGDRNDEEALFHFHNRVKEQHGCIVYTANDIPNNLNITLPDLRSRLSQCTRWILPVLTDNARAEVLRDRAQRRGLILEDAAIVWLLTHSERDISTLVTLLDQLDKASLSAQRRVTLPFLRHVLDIMDNQESSI